MINFFKFRPPEPPPYNYGTGAGAVSLGVGMFALQINNLSQTWDCEVNLAAEKFVDGEAGGNGGDVNCKIAGKS